MKPLQQYFHKVLFVLYVVLTFESVDELLWCYHSNETSSAVLSQGTINCFVCMVLTFESLDEILWCDHSNETYLAIFNNYSLSLNGLLTQLPGGREELLF